MPRPRIKIGQVGDYWYRDLGKKKVVATANYRDDEGRKRQIKVTATSRALARIALDERVANLSFGGSEVNGDTSFKELAENWFDSYSQSGNKYRTIERARSMLDNHLIPRFGNFTISECTTGRLHLSLNRIAVESGPSTARIARTILSGVLSSAVRFDALRVNPVRDTSVPKAPAVPIRALTYEEFVALRALAVAKLKPLSHAERLVKAGGDRRRMGGDNRSTTQLDIIDFLIATGCRASESIGTCWDDVHLEEETPYVVIKQQVMRHRKLPDGTGGGLFLEPTKERDVRRIALPRFAVDMLLRRRSASKPNKWNAVFVSEVNTLLDPANVRSQWRKTFVGSEFEWVTQKTIRKTVATIVEAANGSQKAADMLGHTSDAMTKKHYIEPSRKPVDQRGVLEQFAGQVKRTS